VLDVLINHVEACFSRANTLAGVLLRATLELPRATLELLRATFKSIAVAQKEECIP